MLDACDSSVRCLFALIHDKQNVLTHGEVVDGILAQFRETQLLNLAVGTATGLEQEKILTGGSNENIVAFAAFNNVVSLEEVLLDIGSNPVAVSVGAKEHFDEVGVDGTISNGVRTFSINLTRVLRGHAACKDNVSPLTANQPVSSHTANQSVGGIVALQKIVASPTGGRKSNVVTRLNVTQVNRNVLGLGTGINRDIGNLVGSKVRGVVAVNPLHVLERCSRINHGDIARNGRSDTVFSSPGDG